MGILVLTSPSGKTLAFDDRDVHGAGVPRYYNKNRYPGYSGFAAPTVVGARYFPPEPERDADDNPIPMAYGDIWEGRPAYQVKVHAAAKKGGSKLGFSNKDIDELKPKVIA